MPNWVQSNLTITGESKYLNTLREQLNKPYANHYYDSMSDSIVHNTVEGQFLLWNIVRPTNLNAYFQIEEELEKAKARKEAEPRPKLSNEEAMQQVADALSNAMANFTPESMQNLMAQFQEDVSTGQDWYHWNIREWGTKWEIRDAHCEQDFNRLYYEFATAWSPPSEALDKLSAQYPKLVFTMRSLDEGDCFACEIHWRNGKREFETDLDINHALKEEMYGECWACGDGNENDPDYEDARRELNCAEFNKPIEIEGIL